MEKKKGYLFVSAKMMHTTIYWGRKLTILFDSWQTDSWISYFLSLLACFILSVFYQYMENRRLRFKLTKNLLRPDPSIDTPLLLSKFSALSGSASRYAGAILFGINSTIGYLLMLAVMSFNARVFIAEVVGLDIGYLIFRGGDEDVMVVDNPCACA